LRSVKDHADPNLVKPSLGDDTIPHRNHFNKSPGGQCYINRFVRNSSCPSAATRATASVDTATISNAGKQALQESLETNAQTTKEASHGDLQAKRLLAKEAAARAAREA